MPRSRQESRSLFIPLSFSPPSQQPEEWPELPFLPSSAASSPERQPHRTEVGRLPLTPNFHPSQNTSKLLSYSPTPSPLQDSLQLFFSSLPSLLPPVRSRSKSPPLFHRARPLNGWRGRPSRASFRSLDEGVACQTPAEENRLVLMSSARPIGCGEGSQAERGVINGRWPRLLQPKRVMGVVVFCFLAGTPDTEFRNNNSQKALGH